MNINQNLSKGKVTAIVIAFFAFILIILLSASSSIIGNLFMSPGTTKSLITNWKYQWQNTVSLEDQNSTWKRLPSTTELSAPSNDILHLKTTIPKLTENNISLAIQTNHSPVSVFIDGYKVQDSSKVSKNIFTPVENRWNVIHISKNLSNKTIDVFIKSPPTLEVSLYLTNTIDVQTIILTENAIILVFLAMFFCIGVISILVSILGIFFKKVWIMFIQGLAFMSVAIAFFGIFSDGIPPYFMNTFILYKISIYALFSIPLLTTIVMFSIIGGNKKLFFVSTFLNFFIAITCIVINEMNLLPMLEVMQYFYYSSIIVAIINIIFLVSSINKKIATAKIIMSGYVVFVLCQILNMLAYFIPLSRLAKPALLYGTALYLILLFYSIIKTSIDFNVRNIETEKQIKKNTIWIERVVDVSASVFSQRDIDNFCIEAARNIKKLIDYDRQDENYHISGQNKGKENISIVVAMKENDEFKIILEIGETESFSIYSIDKNTHLYKNEPIIFGNHFLDMYFYSSDKFISLIHFEGIKYGFSDNIKNIIKITYSDLSMALKNLRLTEDMKETQETLIYNFSDISEAKSEETGQHVKRISDIVKVLCLGIGMPLEEATIVREASMMHDVGKLAIPEEIIGKEGNLTVQEFETIMKHTQFGYNMLAKAQGDIMKAAAIIAQQHHEKWDGTGYMGLKGENIHLYGRIVAVADVFDALLSKRTYKRAWTEAEVKKYMNDKSGIHFDPRIIKAFNENFNELVFIYRKFADNT